MPLVRNDTQLSDSRESFEELVCICKMFLKTPDSKLNKDKDMHFANSFCLSTSQDMRGAIRPTEIQVIWVSLNFHLIQKEIECYP